MGVLVASFMHGAGLEPNIEPRPVVNAIRFAPPAIWPVADIYVDYMPQTILQNAFFGNISWEFPDGLKASVGARWYHYSYDQRNSE